MQYFFDSKAEATGVVAETGINYVTTAAVSEAKPPPPSESVGKMWGIGGLLYYNYTVAGGIIIQYTVLLLYIIIIL